MSEAKTTTDHDIIRQWAEERGGRPATVTGTTEDTVGVLRIDFEPETAEGLELIDWDTFFEKFDDEDLAFLYQEETEDGSISRFHKFVEKESVG